MPSESALEMNFDALRSLTRLGRLECDGTPADPAACHHPETVSISARSSLLVVLSLARNMEMHARIYSLAGSDYEPAPWELLHARAGLSAAASHPPSHTQSPHDYDCRKLSSYSYVGSYIRHAIEVVDMITDVRGSSGPI